MDWIKKNYDRFALLLLAVALLASSICVIWTRYSLKDQLEKFAEAQRNVTHKKSLKDLETEALERANASLKQPAAWGPHPAQLLVSRRYVMSGGKLINPFDENSNPLHPPVPNKWFLEHGLEDHILDSDVLDQDPDKDGFTNLDEYLGKTDPLDPASHPGYLTKLRLKQYIKVPFRMRFEAYDDDGNFQINTVDVRQPSQFVKIGDTIANTKFKVVKFEKKFIPNPSTNSDKDVSVLTVEHLQTGAQTDLVVQTETDIPDHYARFSFLWDKTEFSVKKDQIFFLKPEPETQYKLIDIQTDEATITNLKTGSDPIKVPRME